MRYFLRLPVAIVAGVGVAAAGWACSERGLETPTSPTELSVVSAESVATTNAITLAPQGELVFTPAGWYHRSCVYEVPNGARVSRTGQVTRSDDSSYQLPECPYPGRRTEAGVRASLPVNNGWIEDARYSLPDRAYGGATARWNAPANPLGSYSGVRVYYTFPGLWSNEYIVQPVLQYGYNGYFGGSYWTAASWHCDDGSNCTHSTPISVSAGDAMLGSVTASDCQGGECWWTVIARDLTRQTQSTYVIEDTWNYPNAAGGVVEVWGLTTCSQYPRTGVFYSAIALHDEYGVGVTPSWWNRVTPGLDPECDFNVTSTLSAVNLYHNPPPPPPPMTVTISGPSTWPPYQVVTVQALVSYGTPPFTYSWQVNGSPACGNQSWCSRTMGARGTSVYFYVTVTDVDGDHASDYHIVIAQ
jgi:hypothetical protein